MANPLGLPEIVYASKMEFLKTGDPASLQAEGTHYAMRSDLYTPVNVPRIRGLIGDTAWLSEAVRHDLLTEKQVELAGVMSRTLDAIIADQPIQYRAPVGNNGTKPGVTTMRQVRCTYTKLLKLGFPDNSHDPENNLMASLAHYFGHLTTVAFETMKDI